MKSVWKHTAYILLSVGLLLSTGLVTVMGVNDPLGSKFASVDSETVQFWSRLSDTDTPISLPAGEDPLGRVPTPTRSEYAFVGWFKHITDLMEDDAGYYTVSSGASFFGSHLRPQYQGEPTAADYYAVWADAGLFQAAVIDEADDSVAFYEDLDTAVGEANRTGALLKLLADVTPTASPVISVQEGETLVLDMNGYGMEQRNASTGHCFLENWGSLTLENSGDQNAQFCSVDGQTQGSGCLLRNHSGALVPIMRDITAYTGAAFENHGTIEALRNCTFHVSDSSRNSGEIQDLCANFTEVGNLENSAFLENTGSLHLTGGSFTFLHSGSILVDSGAVTFPPRMALPAPNNPDNCSWYLPGCYTLVPLVSISFFDENGDTPLYVYEAPLSPSFRPAYMGAPPSKPDDVQDGVFCTYQFAGWQTASGELLAPEELALLNVDTNLFAVYTVLQQDRVAQVEDRVYPSLQQAVQAVTESGRPGCIRVLSDIQISATEDVILIPPHSNITLDFQDKTLTTSSSVSAPAIISQGDLILRNGTFSTQSAPCLSIQEGRVAIENCQFNTSGECSDAIAVSGGWLEMNDGCVAAAGVGSCGVSASGGTVSISGVAKVSGQDAAVWNRDDAALVTLAGGYFRGGIQGTVFYGTGMSLSPMADEDGFLRVAAPQHQDLLPEVVGDSASVTVPEEIPLEPLVPVTLTISTGSDAVKHTKIILPAKLVKQLGLTPSLTIQTDLGHVVFDAAALTAIVSDAQEMGAEVSLSELSISQLPDGMQAAARGSRRLLDVSLTSGGSHLDFSDGAATLRLPFSPAEGFAPTDYLVYYLSESGGKTAVPSQFDQGLLTFSTSHFSVYSIDTLPSPALSLSASREHYNIGETLTVTVSGSSPETIHYSAFQFSPAFDTSQLELLAVASDLPGCTVTQLDGLTYAISGETIALGPDPVPMAKVSFRVKDIPSQATAAISLADAKLTALACQSSPSQITGTEVALHNIQVNLQADANSAINGKSSLTLYAKYHQEGFYETPYEHPVTALSLSAKEGYRLADRQWTDGVSEYDSFSHLETLPHTQNATYTLKTVKTCTISFLPGSNGTLSSLSPITVDAGTRLSSIPLPKPTGQNGYSFIGWYANGTPVEQDDIIAENITLTPQFSSFLFSFQSSSPNATLSLLSGVTEQKQVTYGIDVLFRVAPMDNYSISEVSYTVEGAKHVLTPDDNGVYTIPGEEVQGDILVDITALSFVTLTFEAAQGSSLPHVTAYKKAGVSGLYADTAFTTPVSPPVPAALPGYRLADDSPQEPLWQDENGAVYTNSDLTREDFVQSHTLHPRAIAIWHVSFRPGDGGTLSKDTVLTVDDGVILTEDQFPIPTGQAGYLFDHWSPAPETPITKDTVFTAHFHNEVHAIDFSHSEEAEFQVISGVEEGKVQCGRDVTFAVSTPTGSTGITVQYIVGSGSAQPLKATDGVYTIPGAAITGPVRVFATVREMISVTFLAGEHGSLVGPTSLTVEKGTVLSAGQIPLPKAFEGYHFVSWQAHGEAVYPEGYLVAAPVEFTAMFDIGSLPVTVPPGLTGAASTAAYGVPFTFTPVYEGHLVTDLRYTVGGGEPQALLPNPDGSYTIPADQVTGPIDITATFIKGSLTFVSHQQYKATPPGQQMVLLESSLLSDRHYTLSDDVPFYWSSLYQAYVRFVDAKETAASVAGKLTTAPGPAVSLSYNGDLNQSGTVTQEDGNIINDLLHGASSPLDDKLRLEMDVTGSQSVTTSDIQWISDAAIGKAP